MKGNERRTNLSIKFILGIVSFLTLSVTMSCIAYLVFSNWTASAEHVTQKLAQDMAGDVYGKIDVFLHKPEHINELNYKLIKNGILDMNNERQREKFFVGVLQSYDKEIYSFSYGTSSGEYYGARRNASGVIEIMRDNAATGGHSWYYEVNADLTAGRRVLDAGAFDPRGRSWYQFAEKAKAPIFSPVYKHFVMDGLAISAASPVYNQQEELQGVLGTHMLITSIGDYLAAIVNKNDGYVAILDKTSNKIISSSLDGNRNSISVTNAVAANAFASIDQDVLVQIYQKYLSAHNDSFIYTIDNQKMFIGVEQYQQNGLNWVIISALPTSVLVAEVLQNIEQTVALLVLAVALLVLINYFVTRKLLSPMNNLLDAAEELSAGNLLPRAEIVRKDELGRIAEAFNKVADKMSSLINNLESIVKVRTNELNKTNEILKDSKRHLQIILDSTAEAIYGIDLEGNCIFCNASCLKILKYSSQEELLGKNMHWQIHHSRIDGTQFPIEECSISQSLGQKEGVYVYGEVFWRSDNTSFYVEYRSYPSYKDDRIVGAVVTFMDITERKKNEEELQYISSHDVLTGLKNRRCFEKVLKEIDVAENLPLSVIFADINGLKMTNDIFGHAAGDELIKKIAEILQASCRVNDVIGRVGGDEFIVLLPKTANEEGMSIMDRIKVSLGKANVAAIKCSVSLGCETKTDSNQKITEIMANAENKMYKDKVLNRKVINESIINNLMETLYVRNKKEKVHSERVSILSGKISEMLGFTATKVKRVKEAGYLHDIGKIVFDEKILRGNNLSAAEIEIKKQHPVVGYRILNLFDDTLDLAEAVYSHHENWDGTGYPKGLKGEEIPVMARIIAVAEVYDELTNEYGNLHFDKATALQKIQSLAGKRFDSAIVEVFIKIQENIN
ncbi:MAG: diguanylate cyclase [Acidaminococcaceae bacterium]